MALAATLTDIIARLRQGRFPNEQAISQGIVLQELGWDTWDTAVGWPEYQSGQGSGDCGNDGFGPSPSQVFVSPHDVVGLTGMVNGRRAEASCGNTQEALPQLNCKLYAYCLALSYPPGGMEI